MFSQGLTSVRLVISPIPSVRSPQSTVISNGIMSKVDVILGAMTIGKADTSC